MQQKKAKRHLSKNAEQPQSKEQASFVPVTVAHAKMLIEPLLQPRIYGEEKQNLTAIGGRMAVQIKTLPDGVAFRGQKKAVEKVSALFNTLALYVRGGERVTLDLLEQHAPFVQGLQRLEIPGHNIEPRGEGQRKFFKSICDHDISIGLGSVGSGKTFFAAAFACASLFNGTVKRIVLARPMVESGTGRERIGFLKGDLNQKVGPYVRPSYDAMEDLIGKECLTYLLEQDIVEFLPVELMRGRSLHDAAILVDEAQNTDPVQMFDVTTRLGEGSKMIITGSLRQQDLKNNHGEWIPNGLADFLDAVKESSNFGVTEFTNADIVRHPRVAEIERLYEQREARRNAVQPGPL